MLSFPFHESAVALDGDFPGHMVETEDECNLGDMVISVPYVVRAMARDARDARKLGQEAWRQEARDTRGVSGAMMAYLGEDRSEGGAAAGPGASSAKQQRHLEARVQLLLVHGLLHLLGHDHERPAANPGAGGAEEEFQRLLRDFAKEGSAASLQEVGDIGAGEAGGGEPVNEPDSPAISDDRVEAMFELMVAEEERLVKVLREEGLLPSP